MDGAASQWLRLGTLAFAGLAALLLITYLITSPPLRASTRFWLLLAVGVFPFAAAMTGNVAGYELTKERSFCASCHTMDPFVRDAENIESASIPSFHSRNATFGKESCYECHGDYRLYGAVLTKVNGLRHLWAYYTRPNDEPHLYKPFKNTGCTRCHSMTLPGFAEEPEHASQLAAIKKGETSCVSSGCHGPAHPTKKEAAL